MKKKIKFICKIDETSYTIDGFLTYLETSPKSPTIIIKTHMDDFYHDIGEHVHLANQGFAEDDDYYSFLGRMIVDSWLEDDYVIKHKVNGVSETAIIKRAE